MRHLRRNSNLIILLTLTILFFFKKESFGQNVNPPFPRIGQVFFYGAGSGGPDAWKNHDLVAVRFYKSWDARNIKLKNPNVILLAANAEIVGEEMQSLLGRSIPEQWFAHRANGERLKLWGGYLMNLTEYCPVVNFIYGNQKFNDFLAQYLKEYTDFNYFDGYYFDGWISAIQWIFSNYGEIDFDNDKIGDGESAVRARWSSGNRVLIDKLRQLTGKLILAHEAPDSYFFNGNAFEFWSQVDNPPAGHASNMMYTLNMLSNAVAPQFNYANSETIGNGPLFRADFTTAQIVGAFFGNDEGSSCHRWTYLHDEYEGNLGYPTSSPREIESGLWIRYFDNGATIANVSGSAKTVTAGQLVGGPYYRFLGNQTPTVNNGYIVDNSNPINLNGVVKKRNTQEPVVIDGIVLFKKPTTLVTPIIIDNVEYNMTTIGQRAARYNGSWQQSMDVRNAYSVDVSWDYTNGWYHAYSAPGNGENTADYMPYINVPGQYEIFEWHGSPKSAMTVASNVPYKINHANGISQGAINQTINTGQWNSLGIYNFDTSNSGYVQISNKANGYVFSDAIKFALKNADNYTPPPPDNVPPNEPRSLELQERTKTSLSLRWSAPLPASDGDIAAYYQIRRDGNPLGTTANLNYSDSGLANSTTYSYEIYAYDDAGLPSAIPATGNFTTLSDIDSIPPEISSVISLSLNTVEVTFSEPVNDTQALDINNYSINNNIQITNAFIFNNSTTVHLKTKTHRAGDNYIITINNIEDKSLQKNKIAMNSQYSYTAVDGFLVYISADNNYELFVNGDKMGDGNESWWEAENYLVLNPTDKNVVAVKGIDLGGAAGVVVEIEYGGVTYVSDDQWKVSTTYEENWQAIDFSDNMWLRAVSYGAYGSTEAKPWSDTPNGGIINGISLDKGVQWIWSADNVNDNTIYLRKTISKDMTPPNPPQGITVRLP